MKDLINKVVEELNKYEKELREDRVAAIDSDDEQMMFAIMNQETAICRIRKSILQMPAVYDDKVVEETDKKTTDACIITLEDFSQLMNNELTSHSRNWIEFNYYLDGKLIDRNTVIPYGYVHYYGDCIVEKFCLNDYLKSMNIYLKSN